MNMCHLASPSYVYTLEQKAANFFYNGSDSKYFSLCRASNLCCNYSLDLKTAIDNI